MGKSNIGSNFIVHLCNFLPEQREEFAKNKNGAEIIVRTRNDATVTDAKQAADIYMDHSKRNNDIIILEQHTTNDLEVIDIIVNGADIFRYRSIIGFKEPNTVYSFEFCTWNDNWENIEEIADVFEQSIEIKN